MILNKDIMFIILIVSFLLSEQCPAGRGEGPGRGGERCSEGSPEGSESGKRSAERKVARSQQQGGSTEPGHPGLQNHREADGAADKAAGGGDKYLIHIYT